MTSPSLLLQHYSSLWYMVTQCGKRAVCKIFATADVGDAGCWTAFKLLIYVHLNCCLNYVVCYLETYFALNTYLNFVLLYGSIHVQHYYMTSVFVSHFYLTSPKLLIDFYLLITRLSFFSDNLSSVHLFQDVTLLHDQPAFLGHQQLYAYCRPNPRAKYLHYRLAGEPTVQLYHLVPKFHRQLLVNANQTTNSLYELCKLQVT